MAAMNRRGRTGSLFHPMQALASLGSEGGGLLEQALRVIVYLCLLNFVYKTQTHKSQFYAIVDAGFSLPSFSIFTI
ncbi:MULTISPECIES: hypothetical protein [Pseudomonas]|uniref:Uncharacterized protein n=1 Tax=Pseudomonas hunanensis TaxID=1247546 RepID=A0ACC6K7B0_9PSED|nr:MULTISPECIES: hypothetical protein [Pseudomonas]MBP2261219.1 hypothetical protein [Pseudomonas sp. BP8]MDR6714309.1 hypothetical protein [Pseudomonas hunanensis]HDS1737676.1 hypothetical protein [Pseudomonas putida]